MSMGVVVAAATIVGGAINNVGKGRQQVPQDAYPVQNVKARVLHMVINLHLYSVKLMTPNHLMRWLNLAMLILTARIFFSL